MQLLLAGVQEVTFLTSFSENADAIECHRREKNVSNTKNRKQRIFWFLTHDFFMQHLEKFPTVQEDKHVSSQIETYSLLIFIKTLNTFSRSYFPVEIISKFTYQWNL